MRLKTFKLGQLFRTSSHNHPTYTDSATCPHHLCFTKIISNSAMQRCIWVFPKLGVPQNGWFIMENPITVKWMILGVSLFLKTPIYIYWFRNPKANTYLGCIKKTLQRMVDFNYQLPSTGELIPDFFQPFVNSISYQFPTSRASRQASPPPRCDPLMICLVFSGVKKPIPRFSMYGHTIPHQT